MEKYYDLAKEAYILEECINLSSVKLQEIFRCLKYQKWKYFLNKLCCYEKINGIKKKGIKAIDNTFVNDLAFHIMNDSKDIEQNP